MATRRRPSSAPTSIEDRILNAPAMPLEDSFQQAIQGRTSAPDNYVMLPPTQYVYDPEKNQTSVSFENDSIDITGTVPAEQSPPAAPQSILDLEIPGPPTGSGQSSTDPTTGIVSASADPLAPSAEDSLARIAEQQEQARRTDMALAGAKFFLDIQNAQSAYAAYSGAAAINIANARMQARDAIIRGQSRALFARQEGVREGESALLAMAAQGQDVTGAAAQDVQSSYETIGVYNALQEETNAIREAMGYELEEAAIQYDLDQRRVERNTSIISSALEFGARAYGSNIM